MQQFALIIMPQKKSFFLVILIAKQKKIAVLYFS